MEEDILNIADKLGSIIEIYSKTERAFIDVRIEKVWYIGIEKTVEDLRVREGVDIGAAVRAFINGAWGFTSTQNLNLDNLERCITNSIKMAKARKGDLKIIELDPVRDYVKCQVKIKPEDVEPEVKVKDIEHYFNLVKSGDYVKSCSVYYIDNKICKLYISSDGREIYQEMYYTYMRTVVSGSKDGFNTAVGDSRGCRDGYTIWKRWNPEDLSRRILRKLESQLTGTTPKAGKFTVIMAPDVVGVFTHEILGHLAEADITMSGSVVKNLKNHKIGSELVTIVDDCEVENGFGTFKYDDEGVKTRNVTIVENGIFRELMVDRTYAALLNQELTGNSRAESFRVSPLIRMRNTIMLPRDYSFEELIENIKFGYYLVSPRGGQANLDGTFQVGIQEAYEIVNGEIRRPVRNMSISGNILDILRNIEAVGKDFNIEFGICGKGQLVYVSTGGPHIKVNEVQIGGFE